MGRAIFLEFVIVSALILATRCANYQDVFVAGNVYFADADCYARMTRVRICAEHPGTIIRHHDFENFPDGTTPHTTAPLDYLILLLALGLKSFSSQAIDLAGAFISPLLALGCGWFLWWWSRRMKVRYRWAMLSLFALSPILVHATKLGRPDHHSLVLTLVTIAFCAEWSLHVSPSRNWSLTSGIAWGLALWVSLYEPLILLALILTVYAVSNRAQFTARVRRGGWVALVAIVAIALAIERRIPDFGLLWTNRDLTNWIGTIGELVPVRFTDRIWFQWCGWMLVVAPLLGLWTARRNSLDTRIRHALPLLATMIIGSFGLTIWQARWAYFFVIIFALVFPLLLEPLSSRVLAWALVIVSIFPILNYWDAQLWPNEFEFQRRMQARREAVEWRALAMQLLSPRKEAFLAPWWLSPAVAYWSHQPGVAGSSHESFPGITDSARFCLTSDEDAAREILQRHRVRWLLVYDSERMLENSRAILDSQIPANPLAQVLDRSPSRAPGYLKLSAQNSSGKLYTVNNFP